MVFSFFLTFRTIIDPLFGRTTVDLYFPIGALFLVPLTLSFLLIDFKLWLLFDHVRLTKVQFISIIILQFLLVLITLMGLVHLDQEYITTGQIIKSNVWIIFVIITIFIIISDGFIHYIRSSTLNRKYYLHFYFLYQFIAIFILILAYSLVLFENPSFSLFLFETPVHFILRVIFSFYFLITQLFNGIAIYIFFGFLTYYLTFIFSEFRKNDSKNL